MNSLIVETIALEKHQNSLGKTVEGLAVLIEKFKPNVFTSEENALHFFQLHGYEAKILKATDARKRADSYIIGIPIGEQTIAIKIHKDIFEHCKAIYSNKELLNRFIEERDIPEILYTRAKDDYRIVIYIWEPGESPNTLLKENTPDSIATLQAMLTRRVESLLIKGGRIICPYPHEFLVRPDKELTLLDANKIITNPHHHKSAHSTTEHIASMLGAWQSFVAENTQA